MLKKTPVQLMILAAMVLLGMAGMIYRLYSVASQDQTALAGVRQGKYHLSVPVSTGTIYDRYLNPINNSEQTVLAVVNPTPDTIASIFTKIKDRDEVSEQLQHISPFVCYLSENALSRPSYRAGVASSHKDEGLIAFSKGDPYSPIW